MLNPNNPQNMPSDNGDDDDYPKTASELQKWILENWASLSMEHRAELFLAICEALNISITEGARRCGWISSDDNELERAVINLRREAANNPDLALGWQWVENQIYADCLPAQYPDKDLGEIWEDMTCIWSRG